MTKIVNSQAANTLFTTNGSAISSSNQPNNTKSTVLSDLSQVPGYVDNSTKIASAGDPGPQRRLNPVHPTEAADTLTGPSNSLSGIVSDGLNTKIQYLPDGPSIESAGFVVGDRVYVDGYGFADVTAIYPSGISVDVPSDSSGNINLSSSLPVGKLTNDYIKDVGEDVANAVLGYTTQINSQANNAIYNGATAPNRDINKTEQLRTRRVGTAIRNNQWHETSGIFTTEPTNASDFVATISGDREGSGLGTVTYQYGSNNPANTRY